MWNQAIVRELAVVLLIKLAAISAIWFAFFSDSGEGDLTHREMGQFLLGESHDGATTEFHSQQISGVQDGY